tara:strand:- start:14 stop:217 length:204 start_codon:yes stop_codon:yes gene_type:complete
VNNVKTKCEGMIMNLTIQQMRSIIKNKTIHECSNDEREQIMTFSFGGEYMASRNKGTLQTYSENIGE